MTQETQTTNYRMERIERLLKELEYETTRGMMERDIDESLDFRFIVPVSKRIDNGVVQCEFRTRPIHVYEIPYSIHINGAKLRVVK